MSIAENIRYGANDRDATNLVVETAAKATNIHDFITTLPYVRKKQPSPGADPENLHGRWLMGWLSIVNHTGTKRVAGQ